MGPRLCCCPDLASNARDAKHLEPHIGQTGQHREKPLSERQLLNTPPSQPSSRENLKAAAMWNSLVCDGRLTSHSAASTSSRGAPHRTSLLAPIHKFGRAPTVRPAKRRPRCNRHTCKANVEGIGELLAATKVCDVGLHPFVEVVEAQPAAAQWA